MTKPGKFNALTDVEGICVGHFTDLQAASGITVILAEEGAVAGVDVRGSAPGTRETDLLDPINLVRTIQGVALCGGSVYGLVAADGVVRWLAENGRGFPLGDGHVAPIVPAAALYDLGRGREFTPPISPDWGKYACRTADNKSVAMGCVGAGTGAVSGNIKGGLGSASLIMTNGICVAALVAVNSLGSPVNPATGLLWELGVEIDAEFAPGTHRKVKLPEPSKPAVGRNTTIGVVATDAVLTKSQACKIAQMAHDGLARAIRPSHTMFDGDTLFCMATGTKSLPETPGFFAAPQAQGLTDVGAAAADCTSRAIVHAISNAVSMIGLPAFHDLENH